MFIDLCLFYQETNFGEVFDALYFNELVLIFHFRVQMRRCAHLLRRFPDAKEDALREKFPLVIIHLS